jgi:hypothetical protein
MCEWLTVGYPWQTLGVAVQLLVPLGVAKITFGKRIGSDQDVSLGVTTATPNVN